MVSNFFSFSTNKNIKSSRISFFILRFFFFFSREKSNFRAESLLTFQRIPITRHHPDRRKLSTKESSIVWLQTKEKSDSEKSSSAAVTSRISHEPPLFIYPPPSARVRKGILSSCRCSWRANRRGRSTGPWRGTRSTVYKRVKGEDQLRVI